MSEESSLKIDPALRLLVFPLSDAEYAALEEKITKERYAEPVVCWGNTLVFGYERMEICKKHGIRYGVQRINFCTKVEIIAMVCEQELRERNLPPAQRRYLIGKLYESKAIICAHRATIASRPKGIEYKNLLPPHPHTKCGIVRLKESMGKTYGLNPATVARYALYADGIERLFQDNPEKAMGVLSGKIKVQVESIRSYACRAASEAAIAAKSDALTRQYKPEAPITCIKDMPAFDPDAEINSLALTVPSWIRFIERTQKAVDFSIITQTGRKNLSEQLLQLKQAAHKLARILEEAGTHDL